jgi:DNA modification methylase
MLYKGTIYWIKANPIPRNRDRRYVTTTENAVILVKKGEKWTFNRQRETYENGLFKYPVVSGSKRIHPTQKPVELLSDLIKIHSNKGDLVFDPFSGSGATAVACKSLERRFIGCEIDSNYYKASIERLNKVS